MKNNYIQIGLQVNGKTIASNYADELIIEQELYGIKEVVSAHCKNIEIDSDNIFRLMLSPKTGEGHMYILNKTQGVVFKILGGVTGYFLLKNIIVDSDVEIFITPVTSKVNKIEGSSMAFDFDDFRYEKF